MPGIIAVVLPKPGYFSRMNTYLHEMFPLPRRLLEACLLAVSFQSLLAQVNNEDFVLLKFATLTATANIFCLFLLLRLMDELKDEVLDLKLFRDRPLPSGLVHEKDIRFSMTAVSVFYLAINSWSYITLTSAVGVFIYSLLMYRYFFMPNLLRRNLLLNLATHNPVIPLMFLQQASILVAMNGWSWKQLDWQSTLLLVAAFWGIFLAWEIARKIRAPEEENEYVTYSQLLGRCGAVLAAFGVQTFTFIVLIYFFNSQNYSWAPTSIIILGYITLIWGYGRFLVKPNAVNSRLKPFAEAYILFVCASVIVNRLFSNGMGL